MPWLPLPYMSHKTHLMFKNDYVYRSGPNVSSICNAPDFLWNTVTKCSKDHCLQHEHIVVKHLEMDPSHIA